MRSWVALAAILISGCSSDGDSLMDSEPLVPDPWDGQDSVVVGQRTGMTIEFDVMCALGGGIDLARPGGLIHRGADRVEITLTTSSSTGYRIGWAIDDGETTWLPVVVGGSQTFDVAVDNQFEEDGERWRFPTEANLAAGTRDCYTGANAGELEITAVAIRGED